MISNYSKIKILVVLAVSSILMQTALAQNGQMSDEQMRQMMQKAQKMQECFENVDQSAMKALAEKGKKVEKEVKELCIAGKRDQAQKMAMAFGKEVNTSEEMQAIDKCGTMAQGMMQNSPWMVSEDGKNSKGGHICDGM